MEKGVKQCRSCLGKYNCPINKIYTGKEKTQKPQGKPKPGETPYFKRLRKP